MLLLVPSAYWQLLADPTEAQPNEQESELLPEPPLHLSPATDATILTDNICTAVTAEADCVLFHKKLERDKKKGLDVRPEEQQDRRLLIDSKKQARGLLFTALVIIITRFLEVMGVRNLGVETKYCFGQLTQAARTAEADSRERNLTLFCFISSFVCPCQAFCMFHQRAFSLALHLPYSLR